MPTLLKYNKTGASYYNETINYLSKTLSTNICHYIYNAIKFNSDVLSSFRDSTKNLNLNNVIKFCDIKEKKDPFIQDKMDKFTRDKFTQFFCYL